MVRGCCAALGVRKGFGVRGSWGWGGLGGEAIDSWCGKEPLGWGGLTGGPVPLPRRWGHQAGMVGYDPETKCVSSAEAAAAGSASGFVTRVFISPLDVIKIRFQVPSSRHARGRGVKGPVAEQS